MNRIVRAKTPKKANFNPLKVHFKAFSKLISRELLL
jgi:hypothetical protein